MRLISCRLMLALVAALAGAVDPAPAAGPRGGAILSPDAIAPAAPDPHWRLSCSSHAGPLA